MSQQKSDAHTYRFAVFGRISSGKTAFLASAAATSISASSGGSISYAETPTPLTRRGVSINEEELVEGRARFRLDFEDSVQRLESRRVPAATYVHPKLIPVYRFMMSSAPVDDGYDGKSSLVDIIDYSGEYLDPDQNLEEAAEGLRTILREMDGLFIFAEAPRNENEDTAKIAIEINALRNALSKVFSEDVSAKQTFGRACILANKWDRISEFDFSAMRPTELKDAVAEEEEKFQRWLVSSKLAIAHQQLYESLRSDLGDDNVDIFPSSAFGRSETGQDDQGNKAEVPAVVPLPYLNVVEPVEKLISIVDEADITYAEKYAKTMLGPFSRLKFWEFTGAAGLTKPRSMAELRKRAAHDPSLQARVHAIGKQRNAALVWRSGSLLASAATLAITATSGYDLYNEGRIEQCRQSPNVVCTAQTVNWLDGFIASDTLPFRIVSKTLILGDATDRREELFNAWTAEWTKRLITNADPRTEAVQNAAAEFKSRHPDQNGTLAKRADEITVFKQKYDDVSRWFESNANSLAEINRAVTSCNTEQRNSNALYARIDAIEDNFPKDIIIGEFEEPWAETLAKLKGTEELLAEARICALNLKIFEIQERASDTIEGGASGSLAKAIRDMHQGVQDAANLGADPDKLVQITENVYQRILGRLQDRRPGEEDYFTAWKRYYENNVDAVHRAFSEGQSVPALAETIDQYRDAFASMVSEYRESWDCAHYNQIQDLIPSSHADILRDTGTVRSAIADYRSARHTKNYISSDIPLIEAYLDQFFTRPLTVETSINCITLKMYHNTKTSVSMSANQAQFASGQFSFGTRGRNCASNIRGTYSIMHDENVTFSGNVTNRKGNVPTEVTRVYDIKNGQTFSVEALLRAVKEVSASTNSRGFEGKVTLSSRLRNVSPLPSLNPCSVE